jgi:hypothetical protein
MSWVNLQSSLGTRAHVVAGPILRRVTPTTVTVWVATRVGARVTVDVVDEQSRTRMTGSRRSVAIGANLHITAVTATLAAPPTELTEGVVYRYDVNFVFDDGAPGTLRSATNDALLTYDDFDLPTFALPPSDLTQLRLIQGSCRKPHADGPDTLALVDDMIASTASNAFARPHQLLLAGDQIYADDVAAILLHMLLDASAALLGWTETLPLPPSVAGTFNTAAQIPSFVRSVLMNHEGFTSDACDSHLITLGEYLSMYLFVWSDELWPRDNLPQLTDILPDLRARQHALVTQNPPPQLAAILLLPKGVNDKIESDRGNLEAFRKTLKRVRRALANIPSYMIFDDHEMTDDWNMNREFCRKVYGSPFGQRVIQNGVVAYTFCQHWGNVPEDLAPATPDTPGSTLVTLLDTPNPTAPGAFAQKPTDYNNRSSQIRSLIGVHEAFAVDARIEHAVFHDAFALTYNYSIVGPAHQVIVTDTRTWRAFPTDSDGLTHLLTKTTQTDQFAAQILSAPDPGNRQLIVALTTNAPPVQPIRGAERHDLIPRIKEFVPDLTEAWNLPSISYDRLLTAITSKLPVDGNGQHTGSVVILSGDVHFSFASRLIFRATNRFEDVPPQPAAAAVVVQLVNSAIHNQSKDTVRFHRSGYFAAPLGFVGQAFIHQAMAEGYVGFNLPKNSNILVGRRIFSDGSTADIIAKVLTTVEVTPVVAPRVILFRQPDYRYRLDYLRPAEQSFQLPSTPPIPPLPGGPSTPEQRKLAARTYDRLSQTYRMANSQDTPDVVGVNNIGEIRFEGASAATRKVTQIVHWVQPDRGITALTTYRVRLDVNAPNDPDFPDFPVQVVNRP